MTEKIICSICQKPIEATYWGWKGGNAAWPVTSGRCCDKCNEVIVLLARFQMFKNYDHKNP